MSHTIINLNTNNLSSSSADLNPGENKIKRLCDLLPTSVEMNKFITRFSERMNPEWYIFNVVLE